MTTKSRKCMRQAVIDRLFSLSLVEVRKVMGYHVDEVVGISELESKLTCEFQECVIAKRGFDLFNDDHVTDALGLAIGRVIIGNGHEDDAYLIHIIDCKERFVLMNANVTDADCKVTWHDIAIRRAMIAIVIGLAIGTGMINLAVLFDLL